MSEFAEYVKECFCDLEQMYSDEIHYRKMFGGYGIYLQGVMFALIADEQLYLKVDEQNLVYFNELNLPAFQFPRGNKLISMSYHLAPDGVFEDSEQAGIWGQRAYAAALRADSKSNKKKTAKPSPQTN